MAAIRGNWSPSANDVLLLSPGFCFGISNFIQHASALGGFGSRLHAALGLVLFIAGFNFAAAGAFAARRLWHTRVLTRLIGHAAIVAVMAPVQFLAIAGTVVFIREPAFVLADVFALHWKLLLECGPLWAVVYGFLVAVDAALAHPRNQVFERQDMERPASLQEGGRILFHADGADHLFDPDEISQVRAYGDYVQVHAGQRRLLVKKTLGEIEATLASCGFLRVHRSALVRANAVAKIERTDSGAYEVKLDCGASIPLSRRRLGEVRSRIATRT